MNKLELQKVANEVRKGIITGVHAAKAGHPGGSLSAADLFTYLYFEEMNVDPKNVHYEDDGVSQQYATAYATTKVTKKQEGNTLRAVVAPREGTYAGAPDSRSYEMRFPATFPPKTVQVNGRAW